MERSETARYGYFCGIDVGKGSNYLVLLDNCRSDERHLAGPLAQSEPAIRQALAACSVFGETLVVVDQFASFGRLVVAVAQDMGIDVAHIPPRKFAKVAESYGEDKTDAKDAFIIADAARSQPRVLELVGRRSEAVAEIKVLTSCRDDIVRERSRCYNRLHDLINQACPALENVLTKEKLHNDLEIRLVAHYGGPAGFRRAGKARAAKWAGSLKYHRNDGPKKVEEIFSAISEQTVSLPGGAVVEEQIKRIAARVIELEAEERALNAKLSELSALLPEVAILKSYPGIGNVYGATIAAEIGDIARFPDGGHLASYGGLSPVKKESGSSVKSKKKRKGGNRRLKNAFIQSANKARQKDEWAKGYYEKKRAEGRGHGQALHALARRRVEVIYAMLATGTFYESRAAAE